MNDPAAAPLIIHASGIVGDAPALMRASDCVRARKRVFAVQIRFAASDCTVPTLEGVIHARAGDAIVTGPAGEQWSMARASLRDKYQPLGAPAPDGEGAYQSLPIEVLALAMRVPFVVHLADGRSQLTGKSGDWLVHYHDGHLGVVAAAIFSATYDIVGSR